MKTTVIQFPGSNCDMDAFHVVSHVLGQPSSLIWHAETALPPTDLVILPGGFSYGDHLRSGAIAARSPVMLEVKKHAERGGLVLGICNGFQVLTESGLLEGALLRNDNLHFLCKDVNLKVENNHTAFSNAYQKGQILRIPIAHGEGNFYADPETLARLEGEGQVVFRYVGTVQDAEGNPNGSMNDIAGIVNARGNVLGLMPHPERASEAILGSSDGLGVFESLLSTLANSALVK